MTRTRPAPVRRPIFSPLGPALVAALLLTACGDPTGPDGPVPSGAVLSGGSGSSGPGDSGGAPTTPADPESCNGTVGPVTVEKVDVPDGAVCVLDGTRVEGNVLVRAGASLEAVGARVEGNIQAEDALLVRTAAGSWVDGDIQVKRRALARIEDTTIGGNLQVEERGASLEAVGNAIDGDLQLEKAGAGLLRENRVGGNVQLEESRDAISATGNHVRGDFQVFGNRGGVRLVENRVEQSLQCKENDPTPTGSGNVAGEKEDQCTGL